jgi:hypothetical protein
MIPPLKTGPAIAEPLTTPVTHGAPAKPAVAPIPYRTNGLLTLPSTILLSVVAGCVLSLNRVTE